MMDTHEKLKELLDSWYHKVNKPDFIPDDPISVPHRFSQLQDIEIAAFFSAVLAWGQRKTIVSKANLLMTLMDNSPYQFIVHHQENDLKRILGFVHRTFQDTDVLYFIDFLKRHYLLHESLETAFYRNKDTPFNAFDSLSRFKDYFFDSPLAPDRTRKHISSPVSGSTCKRLNMFLRWMVRNDPHGVDFGLWTTIPSSELKIPLDVHVENYARQLGLLKRKQRDWKAVEELTLNPKSFDDSDPVKYDYALFGMGVTKEHMP
jgi:uncharacterized protein (TIGR02757 family)